MTDCRSRVEPSRYEGPLDDAEEAGELAEHEGPVSLCLELLELLDEEVDLGRGRLAVMCVVDE